MAKIKFDKETLEKLDKLNASEGLKQVSLGNLVRGLEYLVEAFDEIKVCLKATAEQIKSNMDKVKDTKKTEKKAQPAAEKEVKKAKKKNAPKKAPKTAVEETETPA